MESASLSIRTVAHLKDKMRSVVWYRSRMERGMFYLLLISYTTRH